jgi:putative hydrolases of HD superfamily
MNVKSSINLIFEAAVVKRLERTGWQILGDNRESVGEHTFMTSVIAYLIAKSVPEKVNLEKILIMSLFHDFHESRIGDVDKIALDYITRDTQKANRDIFSKIDASLLASLDEYESKDTLEAKIVYEANILAVLVELKQLVEKGNINAKEWLTGNAKRLHLVISIDFAEELLNSNSQDWWGEIREKLRQNFSK